MDARIRAVGEELTRLPPLLAGGFTPEYGYHSSNLPCRDCPVSVTVDLGGATSFDTIALFPARSLADGETVNGYGFPLRFRVDAAMDLSFRGSVVLVDETSADRPNPGPYPWLIRFPAKTARFVRLTSVRNWERAPGLYILALAEIAILSGGGNRALGRPVTAAGFTPPSFRWAPEYLTDGRTSLRTFEGREISPSSGYHSLIETREDLVKWVQVDLGEVRLLDSVVLVPAHPGDWMDASGFGFPVRFRVEGSRFSDMSNPVMLADFTTSDYQNPGDNPVEIRMLAKHARFVRLTGTRLYAARNRALLAMSEMQVFSGPYNVALHKPVTSLDSFHFPARPLWNPAFLTDGFSSNRRLIPMAEWLQAMDRRRVLEAELTALKTRRSEAAELALTRLAGISGGAVLLTGLISGALVARSWRLRRQQILAVRAEIARDLHDEIGSNLASISLLARVSSSAPADAGEIHRIASETNEALREIVWLLHMDRTTPVDLAERMRLAAERLLRSVPYTLTVQPAPGAAPLPLMMRKNTLFAFKEALTNAVRHSGSSHIHIDINPESTRFLFRITDNGSGFERSAISEGEGLRNIASRAVSLRGHARIVSSPGAGTVVEFDVPLAEAGRRRRMA